jgi:predicted transcriptional regulator
VSEKTVSLREASAILGIDRGTLAGMLRVGKCPFGIYYKEEGSEKGYFYINRTRLEAYITAADMRPVCPYATTRYTD